MQPANLSPEQRKAIKVLQDCLPQWQQYLCQDITEIDICHTNFKGFTLQRISYSDLQHGKNWTWNQSNSKKKIHLDNDICVIVQKFNTRRKRKTVIAGGVIFKMWMFTVFKQTESCFLGVFVWCEKGNPAPESVPRVPAPSQSIFKPSDASSASQNYFKAQEPRNEAFFPETKVNSWETTSLAEGGIVLNSDELKITLDDLSFLSEFIDPQLASTFGW